MGRFNLTMSEASVPSRRSRIARRQAALAVPVSDFPWATICAAVVVASMVFALVWFA